MICNRVVNFTRIIPPGIDLRRLNCPCLNAMHIHYNNNNSTYTRMDNIIIISYRFALLFSRSPSTRWSPTMETLLFSRSKRHTTLQTYYVIFDTRVYNMHNKWIDQRVRVRVAPEKFARPCALRDIIIDLQNKMSTTPRPPYPRHRHRS